VRAAFDGTGAQVLVTGGSSGIGLGIASAFAEAGATVTITGRRKQAAEYDADLSPFRYQPCDLADPSSIAQLASVTGQLDVLVNNAGAALTHLDEWNPDTFDMSVAMYLSGAFRLTMLCRPLLAASAIPARGSVINIASMASFFAVASVPGYGAAKAGVVQMTKTMAVKFAPDPIRVNAVAPGLVATNMTAGIVASRERTSAHLSRIPMRRLGVPGDIAPAVLFLASEQAGYLTGQTLAVDGGFSIQG
jgi:3-oxoacyl-[acyl-carrier protein] reductase